jgi:BirA family biotin operon repressor/biotin-[acetyl-CoA-carboxylase] ligase
MVISKIQTNGKGRGTHSWLSETGGLWLSITLTPPADLVDELQLVGAQSVVKAFSDLDPCFETWVKEPNDVMIGTKKIAGCLVSAVLTGNSCIAYLGLGVNLNNSMKHSFELQGIATTYRDETGRIVDLVEFAFLFLTNFDQNYFKLANKRATPVTRETL